MSPSFVRIAAALPLLALLLAACDVEGRIEGFDDTPFAMVDSVDVEPDSATLAFGGQQQFEATAFAADGSVVQGVDFVWSSGNTAVATVGPDGLVTANNVPGEASISVGAGGIATASAVVVVEAP